MIEFPGEDSVVQEIKEQCEEQFDYAKRCLQLWLDINKKHNKQFPDPVNQVVISLNTKICRLYRTAIELCQRSEAEGASIIIRAIYEALLAVIFVLKPRFIPKEKKNGKIVKNNSPLYKRMTRQFRAKLYVAHMLLSRNRLIDRIAETRGTSRLGKQLKNKSDVDVLKECEIIIGKDWIKRLTEHPKTYSGLSIANLSMSMGAGKYYNTIYGIQSEHVHSTDLDNYFVYNENEPWLLKWHSEISKVSGEVGIASAIFLGSLRQIHKYYDFGIAVNTALDALENEGLKIQQRFKKPKR
jgi:hypothetical protein